MGVVKPGPKGRNEIATSRKGVVRTHVELLSLGIALLRFGIALRCLRIAIRRLGIMIRGFGIALPRLRIALLRFGIALRCLGITIRRLGIAIHCLGIAVPGNYFPTSEALFLEVSGNFLSKNAAGFEAFRERPVRWDAPTREHPRARSLGTSRLPGRAGSSR
jgi:hypothetical protein